MSHRTMLAFVLSALPFPTIAAQEQARIQPGARVRVTAPHLPLGRQVGTVTRIDANTLVIDGSPVAIPTLTRLEVSTGRKSHWLLGMALGFLAGAGTGAIAGTSIRPEHDESQAVYVGAFAGVGAAVGTVVGAIVGAAISTDRWREVRLDRLRLGVMVQRGASLRLVVTLRF